MPPGTARFWSWQFAARQCRAPLLGIYALLAEWRALMDPLTEPAVAQLKLAWWREELKRLRAGAPQHPISRHLAAQPGAASTDFAPLERSLEAAALRIAGAHIERGSELELHCRALRGDPLLLAAQLATGAAPRYRAALESCVAALAAGEYLEAGIADYRREARAGRSVFPLDELLAAGISEADLSTAEPPPHVQSFLAGVRQRAAERFARAAELLPPAERPLHRHLLVLAALGARRLRGPSRAAGNFRLSELYVAWTAARRAAAGK